MIEVSSRLAALPIAAAPRKRPIYLSLWAQVTAALLLAVAVGYLFPIAAASMKPLGDAYIRLITMLITLIIFFTVVSGISSMRDMKKVGRISGKALLYFEAVSTLALVIGLIVGNFVRPGSGFNINPSTLDAKSVMAYAGQARAQTVNDFLMHIIPNTAVDAFARGDILQVLLLAILFGFALSALGEKGKQLTALCAAGSDAVFGVVNIILRFAPLGVFGAMAYTVGKFGIGSLGSLAKLIGTFYVTSILFVFVVLGPIAQFAGCNIFKFLLYIKEEILLVLATSSSETALPTLMEKLENLGCSPSLVGLVVPTGYAFNMDGSSVYITLAALFIAQATNTHLTLAQQLTILAVALLTSKGASGVTGAGFITLVGTLMVISTIPVAGMALILGIDRFMSMFRALINMIGNGVATIVVARWERELDCDTLRQALAAGGRCE
jgi:aerobic C4-dicarboxylate transport protein